MVSNQWSLGATSLACSAFILLLSCHQDLPMETAKPDEQISKIVRAYIKKTKGWPDEAYTLELRQKDESDLDYIKECLHKDPAQILIVEVIHKDDLERELPGGGKSVALYVDVKARKVLKELGSQ